MHKYFIIILLFTYPEFFFAQSQLKYETRAVWLTTAYGLDWPSFPASSPYAIQRQQKELCDLLDKLQSAHLNTVLFQVRVRGDVIYPSGIEPWYKIISGKEGKSPGYDPLAFTIRECHKRGMELHAWLVTIPLGTDKHVKSLGKQSIVKKQPELCKYYREQWYLDPGHPETKIYLMKIIREIVLNYDIDGIHLDYIRYPDRPEKFPDQTTFRKYGKNKNLNEWRRNNITAIVRHIYTGIKALKPWIKVSSSPIGKFRDTSRYTSSGWNAYYTVFQDAQGWLNEGIQDILFPMMYFRGNGFFPFALDWQEKSSGRYIVPGLGIYFLDPSEKDWPLEEIERQINFTRTNEMAGQAFYRARFLVNNIKNLNEELVCHYYIYPAFPLPISWSDNLPPASPDYLEANETTEGIRLSWTPSADNDSRIAPYYVLYASDTFPVDINRPENIIAQRIEETEYIYSPPLFSSATFQEKKIYFAVTAVDRYGNESKAVQSGQPYNHFVLSAENKILQLPDTKEATFITITDIIGRCVFHARFCNSFSLPNLEEGVYRILITTDKNRIFRAGEFIIK